MTAVVDLGHFSQGGAGVLTGGVQGGCKNSSGGGREGDHQGRGVEAGRGGGGGREAHPRSGRCLGEPGSKVTGGPHIPKEL